MRFEHENLGESALLLRVGEGIDISVNARVHLLCAAIREHALSGIEDLVPAYASVLVRFNAEAWTEEGEPPPADRLLARLRDIAAHLPDDATTVSVDTTGRLHTLPVWYGGAAGEDLHHVARHCGLDCDEVIALHSGGDYRVAMLGFAPGFAYLLGLDERLHVPRREQPRTRVPAGSVAIGGPQTGIYPRELPGGWQLIGKTPLSLFDATDQERPCRLMPGDRVRFEAVDEAGFRQLQAAEEGAP